jgi:hypothetical protein
MALEAGGHPRPIAPATSQPMTSRLLSSWPSCNGEAVPFVLRRLAEAARRAGKMPPECLKPAAVYVQLTQALLQLAPGGVEVQGLPEV